MLQMPPSSCWNCRYARMAARFVLPCWAPCGIEELRLFAVAATWNMVTSADPPQCQPSTAMAKEPCLEKGQPEGVPYTYHKHTRCLLLLSATSGLPALLT